MSLSFTKLADDLRQIYGAAESTALVVAPFMTLAMFRYILGELKPAVELDVFTRWIPEELAVGVSDCRIYEVIAARPKSRLFLVNNLHAKYYRADNQVRIGSANVTSKALWAVPNPNLELLAEYPFASSDIEPLELAIRRPSVRVSERMFDAALELQTELRCMVDVDVSGGFDDDHVPPPAMSIEANIWIPGTGNPKSLYQIYERPEQLPTRTDIDSQISEMGLVPGMSQDSFIRCVQLWTRQQSGVEDLLNFLSARERRFGEVRQYLQQCGIPRDASALAWRRLMDWFLFFFPNEISHRRNPHSELVQYIGG